MSSVHKGNTQQEKKPKGFQKGHEFRFEKGHVPWNMGKQGIHLSPHSEFKKGLVPWNKGLKGVGGWPKGKKRWLDKPNPNKGIKRPYKPHPWAKGKPTWNKGKTFMVGDMNPNWKGGINPIHLTIRKSIKYREWIKQIFGRDKYQCQICGKYSNGDLNAHHIKSFTKYPELRFDLYNGITLCKKCHIHLINQHEEEWESYCNFNLLTRQL